MSLETSPSLRLTIEKIVYPGRRLARSGGLVYFTDEGLPGEIVQADVVREHPSYIEARTTAILEASPGRLPPRCGHYSACGPYQPLPYAGQLALKKSQAEELFGKVCPNLAADVEIVPSPREWRYRSKIRFSLSGSGPDAHLAYHVPGSREAFVAADEGCFLASEKAAEISVAVLETVRRTGISSLAEIEIRESLAEGTLLLNLFWRTSSGPAELQAITDGLISPLSPTGCVSWIPRKNGAFSPRLAWGSDILTERIGGIQYEIGAGSFFQVNTGLLPVVLEEVGAAAGLSGRETVADVYGGVGTFGLTLAKKAGRVFVVESSPDNLDRLESNIARNRLNNVEPCPGRGERWMEKLSAAGLDVVFLDPPRKGLEARVIQALLDHPAGKIVYLSCNPATLARDIGLLKPRYGPLSLKLFDFFPQTPHIETLAVLAAR